MDADILREKFLEFFKTKKHKIIESDSLVPRDDPTVLFTPAGMNQFKREFLGIKTGRKRAATAQRCLRTDDLDKVGKTPCHHTFFEMLGNFSFGDYFKKEAIAFAWEFLSAELKIEPDRLWVSVYKDDAEAYKIWRGLIKVPEERIVKLGDKENFWPAEAKAKGPNGPCGPCSEIFFDFGRDVGCGSKNCGPVCDCGRFTEVWNLVFTQFNRQADGTLEPLPKKNIDTGMGLERLAAVMQGVKNNFETDLFVPLVKEITGTVPANSYVPPLVYAIADHLRAIVFTIYDGVLPSNEGRGYVVRKIIRKASLHLRALSVKKPFLYKLVPVLAEIMQKPYPELEKRRENIAEIILAEEKNFISTLESSNALFAEKFKGFSEKPDPVKAGVTAFALYDTYGIPFEITRDWLDKQGIKISQDAFNQELNEQKERSKSQSAMKGDVFGAQELDLGNRKTKFSGYKVDKAEAKVLKIIKDGREVKAISQGEEAAIVLDKTPFYAESGGQVGDSGELIKGKSKFAVLDTKKSGKVIMHLGRVKEGAFKKSDLVLAKIESARRLSIMRNHTATHLLQVALRKVLGPHVQQQGSLVAPERLRFDFTHFKDLSEEQLARVEETVNEYIKADYPLSAKEMPLAQAKKTGALSFFGEKYEDKVRVVAISDLSKEFCGGTHLKKTGQIGLFKITQEGSVASGLRRIEAVTADYAGQFAKEEEQKNIQEAAKRKESARLKEREKQQAIQKISALKEMIPQLLERCEKINDINTITAVENNLDMDTLRQAIDMIKGRINHAVIALGSQDEAREKALLVIGITADLLSKGMDAAVLIRQAAKFIGGSGGGRKDFAQAGGNHPENFNQAFQELKNIVSKL